MARHAPHFVETDNTVPQSVSDGVSGTSAHPGLQLVFRASSQASAPPVDVPSLVPIRLDRESFDYLAQDDVLYWPRRVDKYARLKRVMDLTLILCSLPLILPLVGLGALAIWLESSGPILFRQYRVGQYGRVFTLWKLRTMRVDAEKDGASFAEENDPRILRVGQLLRTYRIDELPQFWNVFKGDMSLIGPRPEQVSFVNEFSKSIPYFDLRHLVQPGITGWAQVNMGYAATTDETRSKLEYDLFYIRNFSPRLDLKILFKTIGAVLTGFGSR